MIEWCVCVCVCVCGGGGGGNRVYCVRERENFMFNVLGCHETY